MNWLKTKMGSNGWDVTDDDVRKPDVLFLGPIHAATQELEDFEEYFNVKYHDANHQELINRCKKGKYDGYAGILWNPAGHSSFGPVDKEVVSALPASMAVISLPLAGYDSFDIDACTAKGVTVTNTPVVSAPCAETVMFLILGCLRHFTQGQTSLRQGKWNQGVPKGRELGSKTVGILGMGGIGKAIAKRANAFGMMINYYSRKRLDIRVEAEYNAHYVALDTLLRESDVLVVCVPLNNSTKHLISTPQFEKMRKGIVFINISRGAVVDEAALVQALASGRVASAGLDVFEFEPKIHDALLKHPQCTLLPHMGAGTQESKLDMEKLALRNMRKFLMNGEAISAVNKVDGVKLLERAVTDGIDISQLSITLQG